MATSPAGCSAIFCEIRRQPSKVKFVYRAIISVLFDFRTCYDGGNEIVIPGRALRADPESRGRTVTSGFECSAKGASRNDELRRRQAMKLGFFTMPMHPIDKDW